MKCKRCGNEMKIKPVEVGKDRQGDPIYNTYAFCYDCKIKVNLDKQREQKEERKECRTGGQRRKRKKEVQSDYLLNLLGKRRKRKQRRKKDTDF